MAVELSEHTASLLREVRPPGTTLFSGLTERDLVGYLTDAFWEAKLDGFLQDWVTDEDGMVQHIRSGGPDISRTDIALVIIYAGIKMLRNRILGTNTGFRAKAGAVEFEQQTSANMLSEMLKQLQATKERLLEPGSDATAVMILDAYSARSHNALSYYGGPELT